MPVTILEADPQYVGGIARTARYKGYHFDIGGHRFFSKSKEVEDLWTELLPNDMLDRPRSSRIFYNGKFFSYPLKAGEALFKLGILESVRCVLSYVKARWFPVANPRSFEDWVSNQFGKRLFNIFFKTYTEKVWGMSCKEISADWAAQRIKGLSLKSAILNAILPKKKPKNKSQLIKTLIDTFRYPRRGPGMMWEACADKFREQGGELAMGMKVVGCHHDQDAQLWTVTYQDADRNRHSIEARHVISSAPMRQLVNGLTPRVSEKTIQAANSLKYRDFLTVVLILKDRQVFDDNWIYIHDPSVKVGRIQNFKSWSPEMVPDPTHDLLRPGILLLRGRRPVELQRCRADRARQAGTGEDRPGQPGGRGRRLCRPPAQGLSGLRRRLCPARRHHPRGAGGQVPEPAPGRPQRHAQVQQPGPRHDDGNAVRAEHPVAGRTIYDLWQVNQDAEYHEAGKAGEQAGATGLRMVPTRVKEEEKVAVAS